MGLKVTRLIDKIRKATQNDDPGSDLVGITDDTIINFINDAQDRLMSRVLAQHPNLYVVEKEYTVTSGTEAYTLPFDAFMSGRIHSVEYTSSTTQDDFYRLDQMSYKNRDSNTEGSPTHYFRRNNKIFLYPVPNSNTGRLRINYIRRLPDAGRSLGLVGSTTQTSASITAMTLTGTQTDLTYLRDNFDHLTVVLYEGTVLERGILFSNIAPTTGVVEFQTPHVWETTEKNIVNWYVVAGKYASTHLDLPDNAERYIVAYGKWQILKMDSSEDAREVAEELAAIEQEYIESISDLDDDVIDIPEIDTYEEIW